VFYSESNVDELCVSVVCSVINVFFVRRERLFPSHLSLSPFRSLYFSVLPLLCLTHLVRPYQMSLTPRLFISCQPGYCYSRYCHSRLRLLFTCYMSE